MNKKIFFSFFILFLLLGLSFSRNMIYRSCWSVYGVEQKDGEVSCLSSLEIKLFFAPILKKDYRGYSGSAEAVEKNIKGGIEYGHEFAFNYPPVNKFGLPFVWISSISCGPVGMSKCWDDFNILFLFLNIIVYCALARAVTLIFRKNN